MQVTYEPSLKDVTETNIFHAKHSPTMRRQRFVLTFGVPLLVLLALLLFLLIDPNGFIGRYYFLFIIFAVLYTAFAHFGYNSSLVKLSKKMYTEKKNKAIFVKRTISIEDDHLLVTSTAGESKTNWNTLEEVIKTEDYIFIYLSSVNIYPVPKTAFESEEEFNLFFKTMNNKLTEVTNRK